MTMESEIRKLRKERKKDNRDWDATWCHCNEKTHNSSLWGKELAFVTTKFLIFDSLRVSWRYALEVDPSPLRVCWNLYNRPYKLEILQHRGKIYQNMAKSFNFSLFQTAQYRQEALLFFVPAFVEVEALQVHTLLHWIATFTHLKSHMVAEVKNWEPEVVCCLTLFNGKSTQKVIVVSCHLLGQSFLHAGLPYTTVRFGKLMSVARLLVQFCWHSLIAFSFCTFLLWGAAVVDSLPLRCFSWGLWSDNIASHWHTLCAPNNRCVTHSCNDFVCFDKVLVLRCHVLW